MDTVLTPAVSVRYPSTDGVTRLDGRAELMTLRGLVKDMHEVLCEMQALAQNELDPDEGNDIFHLEVNCGFFLWDICTRVLHLTDMEAAAFLGPMPDEILEDLGFSVIRPE